MSEQDVTADWPFFAYVQHPDGTRTLHQLISDDEFEQRADEHDPDDEHERADHE